MLIAMEARKFARKAAAGTVRLLAALPLLLLTSLAAAASSTITVQGTGSSRAMTSAFMGINIDNTSGKAMLWTDTNTWSWINQLGVGSVRAPSGAGSNYWDWKHGRRYGWPGLNDPLSALFQLDQNTHSPDVMYVLNVMTYGVSGSSVLATPGDGHEPAMINDQIAALASATTMGIPIPRVERGNEFYLLPATAPDYCARFPPSSGSGGTCSIDAVGDDSGATYANEMNPWISALKTAYPGIKIGMVGVNKGSTYRQTNWNADMLPVLQSGTPDTGAHADAVIYHDYVDMTSPTQTFDSALSAAFTDWAWLDRQIQTAKSYGINEAWITEWNIHNTDAGQPFQDTWMHALLTAQMLVQYSTEPMITVLQPWPLGDEQFNSTVFFPGQVQIGPAASSVTYTIPQPGMFSAHGQALAFFAQALQGVTAVSSLALSGIPMISAPSGQTAYTPYPAVTGLKLGGRGVFLNNLSSMTLNVDVSLFSRSAAMASISASSLGAYITPSQGVTSANTSFANGVVTLPPYSINSVTFTAAPPIVSISAPASGGTLSGTASITGSSTGTIWNNVNVSSVGVSVDSGAYSVATGTGNWTFALNTLAMINGPHTLQAAAWDSSGVRSTSTFVNVTVSNPGAPPAVALSTPSNGATIAGASVISGTSWDNVAVSSVAVSVDSGAYVVAAGTANWTFGLDTRTLTNGTHTLRAAAWDLSGHRSTSTLVNVVVINSTSPPVINITSPANGAALSGMAAITGTSWDSVSVLSVGVSIDSGAYSVATGTGSWTFALNTLAMTNGPHTLQAAAWDASGNRSTTTRVNLTVSNPVGQPVVAITSPTNGSAVSGPVLVTAAAFSAAGVAKVQFFVDGGLVATDTAAPYNFSWDTQRVSNSAHSLTAECYDRSGNASVNSSVAVSVQNIGVRVGLVGAYSGSDVVLSVLANAVIDPTFPSGASVTFAVGMPSGSTKTVNMAVMPWNPTGFYAVLPLSAFSAIDVAAFDGAALTVGDGAHTFAATGQRGVVEDQIGGLVSESSGTAQLLVLPGGVPLETQISLTTAAADAGQTAALARGSMTLMETPRLLAMSNPGTIAATLTLPFDSAMMPQALMASAPVIAVYNSTTSAWFPINPSAIVGAMVSASVTQAGLYAPVVVQAVSTPGLQDVYVYPNPAVAPQTPIIRAEVGLVDSVEVTIFDVAGKVVNSGKVSGAPTGTFNGVFYYDYPWTGAKASGVYFAVVHAKAPDGTIIRGRVKFAVVR
jgi:hypothetical protein